MYWEQCICGVLFGELSTKETASYERHRLGILAAANTKPLNAEVSQLAYWLE